METEEDILSPTGGGSGSNSDGDDLPETTPIVDEVEAVEENPAGIKKVAPALSNNKSNSTLVEDPDDPLNKSNSITLAQLRNAVKNMPHKKKTQTMLEFDYSDEDSFTVELDEFFGGGVEKAEILALARTSVAAIDDLELIQEELEIKSCEKRISALKRLLYIALGTFSKVDNDVRLVESVKFNNLQLLQHKFLLTYHRLLQMAFGELKNISRDDLVSAEAVCVEVELILNLIFLLIHGNSLTKLKSDDSASAEQEQLMHYLQEFIGLNPSFTIILLQMLLYLNDNTWNPFLPIKKIVILQWKCSSVLFGSLSDHTEHKRIVREQVFKLNYQVDFDKCLTAPKLNYKEYLTAVDNIKSRFPSIPGDFDQALLSKETLFYLELLDRCFPFKPVSPNESSDNIPHEQKEDMNMNNNENTANEVNPIVLYPSKAMKEAITVLAKHLFISPAQIQYTEESKISKKEPTAISSRDSSYDSLEMISEAATVEHLVPKINTDKFIHEWASSNSDTSLIAARLGAWEEFSALVYPHMASHLVMLLKILLSVNTDSASGSNQSASISPLIQNVLDSLSNTRKGRKSDSSNLAQSIVYMETKRNHEIVSKAILSHILLLLKHAKNFHVLQFEYISQLLVDANCLLLILKIVNQDLSLSITKGAGDLDDFLLSKYIVSKSSNSQAAQNAKEKGSLASPSVPQFDSDSSVTASPETGVNNRCFFSAINLMRILQKLTKKKQHRINILIQYKFAAIVKKTFKISHPILDRYNYKLLRSITTFMIRKWKQTNMKLITGVYMNVRPDMIDSWMLRSSQDQNFASSTASTMGTNGAAAATSSGLGGNSLVTERVIEEAQQQETILRRLISNYCNRMYVESEKASRRKDSVAGLSARSSINSPKTAGASSVERDATLFNLQNDSVLNGEGEGSMMDEYDVELDELFMKNYEQWLEDEVYSTTDSDTDEPFVGDQLLSQLNLDNSEATSGEVVK